MKNILFIGNSYTFYNNMPELFQKLALENSKIVSVQSVTKGGRKLISYKDGEDPITLQLNEALDGNTYDVCFIQEQSVLPASDFELFMEGVEFVVKMLENKANSLILYATWGRKEGSEKLKEFHWTSEQMTSLLSAAYQKAADKIGADISPVGIHFQFVTKNYPEIDLYNTDLSHPSYSGSCLAALTHYATVFGEFPEKTSVLSLSENEINAFRHAILK